MLKSLTTLSLVVNQLDGSISISFGELVSLELLDISYNNLSGEILKPLEELLCLKDINLFFNKPQGDIPSSGQFIYLSAASFMSNHGLCDVAQMQVPPCKAIKAIVVKIVKFVSIAMWLMILAIYVAFVSINAKRNCNLKKIHCLYSKWRRISHQEVI